MKETLTKKKKIDWFFKKNLRNQRGNIVRKKMGYRLFMLANMLKVC